MESGFYLFLGMACGTVIGMEYFKHQIVRRKNPKVIARVKSWIAQAENGPGAAR